MTDILCDRIAAVLYERHYRLDGRPSDLTFNDLEPEIQRVYLADADAVIEALSDVLKTSNSHACGVHCPYGPKDERCHHWMTANDDDEIRPALKEALASWDDDDD